MAIPREQIDKIAALAALDRTHENYERVVERLAPMIALLDTLGDIDLSGVEDPLDITYYNAFRADVPVQEFTREQLLANAPVQAAGCVLVPRIME